MLSIVRRKSSILAWETFFCLSLLALRVLGVSDVEASRKKLNSVYIGQLSAKWIDAEHVECAERSLGVLDNSTLTFGPTHDLTDTNPYFISLMSPQTSSLAVSMQSSISSQQLVATWWEVEAKLESSEGDYLVSGTLENDTNLDNNSFSGSFGKTDSDWCGFQKQTFIWKYNVNASTFSGTISATEAVFSIDGGMLDEDTNRFILFTIQFYGKWNLGSAKLSFDKPTPTWPSAGNLDGGGGGGAREQSQSSILVDAGPTPTIGSGDNTGAKDISRKLGSGAIVSIIATSVFALGFIIMAISCIIQRRKRQKDGKVYPKIAYIYTPSQDASADSSERYSKILAHHNRSKSSDLEVRQVLVNDNSLPVTDQHQWRAF